MIINLACIETATLHENSCVLRDREGNVLGSADIGILLEKCIVQLLETPDAPGFVLRSEDITIAFNSEVHDAQ